MDLRCISMDNQMDTPMGTSVLGKTDWAYQLPTSRASLKASADSTAEELPHCGVDTQACDKDSRPTSGDNNVIEIPIFTSVLDDFDDSAEPLPTLEASVEAPLPSILEDSILSTPRKHLEPIPCCSLEQVLEANPNMGGSIDIAVANSPPVSLQGGSIDVSIADAVPHGG